VDRTWSVRENALYLVFKLVTRLSLNWRAINGPNQLLLLLAGERFVDGKLQRVSWESTAVSELTLVRNAGGRRAGGRGRGERPLILGEGVLNAGNLRLQRCSRLVDPIGVVLG
jgi:hypothetical protein